MTGGLARVALDAAWRSFAARVVDRLAEKFTETPGDRIDGPTVRRWAVDLFDECLREQGATVVELPDGLG